MVYPGSHTTESIKKGLWSGMEALSLSQRWILAATALLAYAIAYYVLNALGLPAIPHVSSLLLLNQPVYAALVVGILVIVLTLMTRPIVGTIRDDAPLFCAAIALLALPTRGGDLRNALFDGGGPGVYLRMVMEIVLLSVAYFLGYLCLIRRTTPDFSATQTPDEREAMEHADSPAERAYAVGLQAVLTLALLSILGQSPMKGQAMFGLALASGAAAWITHKTRLVQGSIYYVAGTMLAGVVAYIWAYTSPDGWPIGDVRGILSGAVRSLPLHYATAGVTGTIYGYWGSQKVNPDVEE